MIVLMTVKNQKMKLKKENTLKIFMKVLLKMNTYIQAI